jgi:hypothetical protein
LSLRQLQIAKQQRVINGVNFTHLSSCLAVEGLKFGNKESCSRFLFIGGGQDKLTDKSKIETNPISHFYESF